MNTKDIPTYSRTELLEKKIKLFFSQTYKNLKNIEFLDGYFERTNLLMDKYKNKNIINYYCHENYKEANFASKDDLKRSFSKLITFLDENNNGDDADNDVWQVIKVSKQVEEGINYGV